MEGGKTCSNCKTFKLYECFCRHKYHNECKSCQHIRAMKKNKLKEKCMFCNKIYCKYSMKRHIERKNINHNPVIVEELIN
jgi:hypothetical protein